MECKEVTLDSSVATPTKTNQDISCADPRDQFSLSTPHEDLYTIVKTNLFHLWETGDKCKKSGQLDGSTRIKNSDNVTVESVDCSETSDEANTVVKNLQDVSEGRKTVLETESRKNRNKSTGVVQTIDNSVHQAMDTSSVVSSGTSQQCPSATRQALRSSNNADTSNKGMHPRTQHLQEGSNSGAVSSTSDNYVRTRSKCLTTVHQCNVCQRVFKTSLDLLKHGQVHMTSEGNQDCVGVKEYGPQYDGPKANLNRTGMRDSMTLNRRENDIDINYTDASSERGEEKEGQERLKSASGETPVDMKESGVDTSSAQCVGISTITNNDIEGSDVTIKGDNSRCNYDDIDENAVDTNEDQAIGNSSMGDSEIPDSEMTFKKSDANTYDCTKCSESYLHAVQLKFHMKVHNKDNAKVNLTDCDICGKGFSFPNKLLRHLLAHSDERPVRCSLCNKTFKTNPQLESHMLLHSKEKSYICEVCGRFTAHLSGYKAHMETHSKEKKYECDVCHKKFNSITGFGSHRRVHTRKGKFLCELCNTTYRERRYLLRHQWRTHAAELKHECSQCGKRYLKAADLNSHQRACVANYLGCEYCFSLFGTKESLESHRKVHLKA